MIGAVNDIRIKPKLQYQPHQHIIIEPQSKSLIKSHNFHLTIKLSNQML